MPPDRTVHCVNTSIGSWVNQSPLTICTQPICLPGLSYHEGQWVQSTGWEALYGMVTNYGEGGYKTGEGGATKREGGM